MKINKIMAILLSCSFIASAFTGCGKTVETPSEPTSAADTASVEEETYENGLPKNTPVILKVGLMEGGYGFTFHEKTCDLFMKKYPNVTIQNTSSPSIGEKVKTLVQSKNDKEMYHVATIPSAQYADQGLLEPLDSVYEAPMEDAEGKPLKDLLYPGIYEGLSRKSDGHIYYVVKGIAVGGMFYNKNLFEQKGWNQSPKCYSEFMDLCQKIKDDGVIPMTYSGMYNYLDFAIGRYKMYEIAEENGTLEQMKDKYINVKPPLYDIPERHTMYDKVAEMGKKGYFANGLAAQNHTISQMLAMQGKVAMVSTCDWVAGEMEKEDDAPKDFNWGFMPVPLVEKSGSPIYVDVLDSDSFAAWKNKPELEKKWALEFIRFTLSLDAQYLIASEAHGLPVRKDFYDKEENIKILQPIQQNILSYLQNNNVKLCSIYYLPPHQLGDSFSDAWNNVTKNLPLICENKITVDEVLKKSEDLCQKGIEEGKKLESKK